MSLSSASSLESTLTVISLKTSSLEEIVKQNLCHILNNQKDCKNLLRRFYFPLEKALIRITLEFHKGNQIKAAQHLGLNRNTLKRKISLYNINIKSLMMGLKDISLTGQELFVSSVADLNLTEVARRKFLLLQEETSLQDIPCLIKRFCQPIEKIIIETVLEHFKGHQIKTAKALGINRNTLKNKQNFYKIQSKKQKRGLSG